MSLGRIGGVYAALHAGSQVADYWGQTNDQAETKGKPGRDGRAACARHVATLTATQALFLGLAATLSGERLQGRRVVAGLALNAATHYWADRRFTLEGLADRLECIGKGDYYRAGGAPHLDQAFHTGVCALAAMVIGGGSKG